MANKVLVDIMKKNQFDAGSKARNDIKSTLDEIGFDTVSIFDRSHNNILRIIELYSAMSKIKNDITDGEMIIVQYPYKPQVMKLIINQVAEIKRNKKCKLVYIIHDIVYLRNEKDSCNNIEEMCKIETDLFNSADLLIVHNEKMKNELLRIGVNTEMLCLQLFDYLYNGESAKATNQKTVVFAGNLSKEKSGFIYDNTNLENIQINLYGTKPEVLSEGFNYKGIFNPDELIANMEGNFGLVWDGPSAQSCIGNYGEYLKYNNPHKCSLYLAAGLPVVIWNQSALADFICKNHLGFCISSLDDLNSLPEIDSPSYQEVKIKVEQFKEKLTTGTMLKQILSNL